MARAVGIDLGTTNSVVAVLEAGEPVVVPNAEGSRTTPSVVGFSKNNEILVGEVAKRQAITNPDRTIRSVKRHMGEKDWSVDVDGKAWTAQEVSAQILLKLKRDAEAYLGDSVNQAVDHRAGLLRRRAAPGHQGGRADRGPRGPAHHQRAHRRCPGLRARQAGHRADGAGLRPGRRHVRRLADGDRRRRVRGQGHPRRHPSGWRRLGPADHRLPGQGVQERARGRPSVPTAWRCSD